MDVESAKEERTRERESRSRQAGCVELLFVEVIWQTKRAQWADRLWVGCCCLWNEERRQKADSLTALRCLWMVIYNRRESIADRQVGCCGTKRAQLQLQFELSGNLN